MKNEDKIDLNEYDKFLEWVKNKVPTVDYIEISREYEKYIDRQKKSESVSTDAGTLPSWTMPWIGGSRQQLYKKETDLTEDEKHRSRQDNIYSGIEKLDYQIFLLNNELENLNSRLEAFSYPQYLGRGILVLGYLAAFGILLPVGIIYNESFNTFGKILVLVLFGIGVAGVFSYITFLFKELRRH